MTTGYSATYPLLSTGKFHAPSDSPIKPEIDASLVNETLKCRGGIDLQGIKIIGPLNLTNCFLNNPVLFIDCDIEHLDATDATFNNVLDLTGSRIRGDLVLLGVSAKNMIKLENTHISENLSLLNCRISSGLPARRMIVCGEADVRELTIGSSADFTDAIFEKNAIFSNARIELTFDIKQTLFCSEANFDSVQAFAFKADKSHF